MRNLPARPHLNRTVQRKLLEKTLEITQAANRQDQQKLARDKFKAARSSRWFEPIVKALRSLCGEGELCMYCSSNEPSQMEHYRTLSVFPEHAFDYENYLWTCDICNRTYKGERFPPVTEPGAQILNPLDDNVWNYFFLDETFGRLLERIDPSTGQPMERAISTCQVVGINRENVQIKRKHRYNRLQREASQALEKFNEGRLTHSDLIAELIIWRSEPFQSDVADYFLNGPGRGYEPFRSVLVAAGESLPSSFML